MFRLMSLFSGSGGFELAGSLCGITPVAASEVEPYPIAVTTSRFPKMKHLGSVTEVNGAEVEPVDVITFGSPCQDLSVAGKRAGLKHTGNGDDETTRSGLFMEAIRIVKEMREATHGLYPRFAVWENVPGAFSSNKGEDFRIVLEEFIKVVEPTAVMPTVPKNGWSYADSYCGDGWSLSYRVFDAQFWGVPQRRRRIYLVADFRGQCAGKVSFEREGLRGYFAKSGAKREEVARDAESGIGAADCGGVGLDIYNLAETGDIACSLTTATGQGASNTGPSVMIPYTLKIRSGVAVDSAGKPAGKGALIQTNKAATLAATQDQYLFQPMSVREENWEESPVRNALRAGESKSSHCVVGVVSIENHPADSRVNIDDSGKVQTLTSRMGTGGGNVPMVMEPTYCLQGNGIDRADTAGCNGKGWKEDICYTLNTIDRPAVAYTETYQKCTGPLMANSHPGSYSGQDAYNDMFVVGKEDVAGVDCRNFTETEELYPTLQAKPNGGQSLNYSGAVRVRYVVRRLTPTECARLQGFPDNWGHPDIKESLSDEEYAFWLNVRNTHATINGKATKEYTKEQMLTWYNKLHTDSSEYKLWGNGIALPCALYIMQGIAEVLVE